MSLTDYEPQSIRKGPVCHIGQLLVAQTKENAAIVLGWIDSSHKGTAIATSINGALDAGELVNTPVTRVNASQILRHRRRVDSTVSDRCQCR